MGSKAGCKGILMIKKCPECEKGNIDFSLSEVHLIPDTDPQQAGIEGICKECQTNIYVRFEETQYEIMNMDDFMNDSEGRIVFLP